MQNQFTQHLLNIQEISIRTIPKPKDREEKKILTKLHGLENAADYLLILFVTLLFRNTQSFLTPFKRTYVMLFSMQNNNKKQLKLHTTINIQIFNLSD